MCELILGALRANLSVKHCGFLEDMALGVCLQFVFCPGLHGGEEAVAQVPVLAAPDHSCLH